MRKFTITEHLVHEYMVDDSVIREARPRLTSEWPSVDWSDEEIVRCLFEEGDLDLDKNARCVVSIAVDRETVESTD